MPIRSILIVGVGGEDPLRQLLEDSELIIVADPCAARARFRTQVHRMGGILEKNIIHSC